MNTQQRFLVTGGAGFIGTAVIRHLIHNTQHIVVNVDKLTYAGNLESLKEIDSAPRYHFEQMDVCDGEKIAKVFQKYQPDIVMHLAAESM
jgi:dTDP-glucose 4,6-dehydratase